MYHFITVSHHNQLFYETYWLYIVTSLWPVIIELEEWKIQSGSFELLMELQLLLLICNSLCFFVNYHICTCIMKAFLNCCAMHDVDSFIFIGIHFVYNMYMIYIFGFGLEMLSNVQFIVMHFGGFFCVWLMLIKSAKFYFPPPKKK